MTLIDLDAFRPVWRVGQEHCRICNYESVCIVHQEADPDRLQCGRCFQMTSRVTHWLDDDGATWRPRFELVRPAPPARSGALHQP